MRKYLVLAVLVLLAVAILGSQPRAQQTERFLYAALPGVGGGNNLTYGGAGNRNSGRRGGSWPTRRLGSSSRQHAHDGAAFHVQR